MSEAVMERPTAARGCGRGELSFDVIGGRTAVSRVRCESPLRLLCPKMRGPGRGAWAFTSTFGGGLLGGDEILLDVAAGPGAVGYLATQSATKVYRSDGPAISRQALRGRIAGDAVLMAMPDPVVCFAGARYRQEQRIEMDAAGGLVLLDWFTSGRHERGERWQAELHSRNEIWIDGRCILRDALALGGDGAGGRGGGFGMGEFNCMATVILAGRRLAKQAAEWLAFAGAAPVKKQDRLPMGASALAGGGAIFRIAGPDAESVRGVLMPRLEFVQEFLGECPWRRKW